MLDRERQVAVTGDHIPVVRDETVTWIKDKWAPPDEDGPSDPVFGFLSVPFDFAVSHRPGCRFGPESILAALNGYTAYCADKRVSLERAGFANFGAVDIVRSFEQSYQNIRNEVAAFPNHISPIILGGDHSISDPCVRGAIDRNGGRCMGLLVIDAHFDSREPIPGKEHSGHWMHTLGDVIDYSKVAQLGINAPIYSEAYMQAAQTRGVYVATPYDIRTSGQRAVVEEAIAHVTAGTDGVYLTVDIDAVDQAFAPGTSVPNPCGLLAHEVVDMVYEIAASGYVRVFDLTEVSPPLDRDGMTSQLAAGIVMNYMAGVVQYRARTGPVLQERGGARAANG
ncbi:agmatinase family protein [Hoeflea poritis]|uniref:Agmatinase family protein n=1 Tax=Hoeflea poritis TaxID=2993659 RepID=A0ABT4VKK1_9HYPH|nr:agmatinase family protein [Hoeflea poritis]MDA4845241.1 agmatinase family protein [Hoeflea poritis]